MRGVSASLIVVSLMAVLYAVGPSDGRVYAQSLTVETAARVEPAEQSVLVGQEASVDVHLDDVSDLYGADIRLFFDPLLLAVVDANPSLPGVQVALGPLLTGSQYFAIRNQADNSTGEIWVALTQLNPAPPVNGSGVFMRVTFSALAEGAASVHFTSIELADRNGSEIGAVAQDGMITVASPASLPFSVWLPIIGVSF